LASRPPLPEEGPLVEEPASLDPEDPETIERRDGDEVKNSSEDTDSNQSPPPADSEGEDEGRKRKDQEDLISLGTSKFKDVPLVKQLLWHLLSLHFCLPWLAQTREFPCFTQKNSFCFPSFS
jgi:hypothetical protein